jgi:hypothetical protein
MTLYEEVEAGGRDGAGCGKVMQVGTNRPTLGSENFCRDRLRLWVRGHKDDCHLEGALVEANRCVVRS